VYDNTTGLAVNTPKSYGKSIKASQLSEGVAKFFPVGDATSSGLPKRDIGAHLAGDPRGGPGNTEYICELEVRMVGGSLLVIYEADWQKLKRDSIKKRTTTWTIVMATTTTTEKKPGPPFVVKVIDFAHTILTPGARCGQRRVAWARHCVEIIGS
jgi:1D-myo-inositol-tetrakisphosphate 5-kinase/inositol-polyphosphate multikinase